MLFSIRLFHTVSTPRSGGGLFVFVCLFICLFCLFVVVSFFSSFKKKYSSVYICSILQAQNQMFVPYC